MSDINGALPVGFAANATTSSSLAVDTTARTVSFDVDGSASTRSGGSASSIAFQIAVGTFATAKASFEATIDDSTWFYIDVVLVNTGTAPGTFQRSYINGKTDQVALASGPFVGFLPGASAYSQVRIRCTTTGTGTGTVTFMAAPADGFVRLAESVNNNAAWVSGDLLLPMGLVRRDAGDAVISSGNEHGPLTGDALGHLWIAGTQKDNTALTLGTSSVLGIGGITVDPASAPGTLATAGDLAMAAITQNREWHTIIRDGAGNHRAANVDASGNLQVSVAASATGIAKAEDAASANADVGAFILNIQEKTPANDVSADGDYQATKGDTLGRLYVNANRHSDSTKKIVTKTAAAVSAGGTSSTNLDYTVTTGKTFIITRAVASASGKIKLDFQINAVSQLVAFNSTANPQITLDFEPGFEGASTQVVHPIITNLEASAMDVYITYWGVEV